MFRDFITTTPANDNNNAGTGATNRQEGSLLDADFLLIDQDVVHHGTTTLEAAATITAAAAVENNELTTRSNASSTSASFVQETNANLGFHKLTIVPGAAITQVDRYNLREQDDIIVNEEESIGYNPSLEGDVSPPPQEETGKRGSQQRRRWSSGTKRS